MWPFRKKKKPATDAWPPTPSDECEWAVGLSEADDGPLIVRVNETAANWQGHPQLSIKLGFAVPLQHPNPGGLPNPDENQILDGLEDQINDAVSRATVAIQVLALTNGVMKEFIFQIPEGVDIKSLHESLQEQIQSHEVQCIAERDPDWNVYSTFRQMM